MGKGRFRKAAALALAIAVCMQPLAVSASTADGAGQLADSEAEEETILGEETGNGTVTAEEGYAPATADQDPGKIGTSQDETAAESGGQQSVTGAGQSRYSHQIVPGREDTVGYTAEEIQQMIDDTLIVEKINGEAVDAGEFQTEEELDATTGKNDTVVLSQLEENREIREQEESVLGKLMDLLSPALTVQASSAGSTAAITPGTSVSYGGWNTHVYTVQDGSGSYTGFCLQPNSPSPSGTFTAYELNNNVIKYALACYYADGKGCVTGVDEDGYAGTHAFVAYVYSGQTTGLNDVFITLFENLKNQIAGYFAEGSDPAVYRPDGSAILMSQVKLYYAPNAAQDIAWINVEENGYAKLQKASANTSITDGNSCYSLAGAQYGVYSDSACSAQVATLTTDANGNSNTVELAAGTYYVKEIAAPKGYAKDEKPYPVTVKPNETSVVKVADEPLNDPAAIEIKKIDAETGSAFTQGAASLAGAQFEVKYYDGYYTEDTLPEEATRTWVLETKEVTTSDGEIKYYTRLSNTYKVSGDDFYYQDGIPTLPLGTITVEETKAPTGYLLDHAYLQADGSEEKVEGPYISQIKQEGVIAKLTGGNEYSVSDRVIRGDFEFTKRDEETQEAMAGIPFRLTSNTTGESHVIVTDENGYYSSSTEFNQHSRQTNANDSVMDGDYDASAGLWFGLDADGNVAVNDAYGALPYDTYTLEEVRCDQNEDKALYKGTLTVTRDGFSIDLGTIENADVTLQTLAKDEETNSHYAVADDEVTIIDTVSYTGLKRGKEYTLKGTLMNRGSGEPVMDGDGNPVTSMKVFTPKTAEGTVEMEFTFDASDLAGADVVVYEELYLGTELAAEHKDIDDEGQTIHFPAIQTAAADSETGTNLSKADEEITVIDTVAYRNLQPGRKYTVTGILMDKETGEAVLDADGETITSSVEFTPEVSDGSMEVLFIFNGSSLAGKTLVAFETLERNGRVYAVHADLEDEAQTIHIPKIGTAAADRKTGTHKMEAAEGAVIVDTVAYENLVPGLEYTVRGILMDQETGKPFLQDGREITAEKTFIPGSPYGALEVEFTFDASGLSGKGLTVFEELYLGTETVAEHKDLQDAGQTVRVEGKGRIVTSMPGNLRGGGSIKTGDDVWIAALLGTAAAALGGVAGILAGRKEEKERSGAQDEGMDQQEE